MKRFSILTLLLLISISGTAWAVAPRLPINLIEREQTDPFPGGGATPAYKLRAGEPGTQVQDGDLAFDLATEVGPAVQKILEEIGDDPRAAYLWVRNNVEYEPYHGIKRGAEGVAWEKKGNSFDQAALLAALLRSQGVPARFAYGIVRLSGKNTASWCGVSSENEAYRLLVQSGVPTRTIRVSGLIQTFEVNHCWLEAHLPYTNPGYRGPGERVWIPLDPSYKKHDVVPGQDLFPRLGFDEEEFLLDYLSKEGDPSPEDVFRDVLRDKLMDMGLSAILSQAAYDVSIIAEGDGALPVDLPKDLDFRGIIWEESAIPEIYNYRIRVTIWDGKEDGTGFSAGDVRVTFPTAYLSSHSLTITYEPATPADEALAAGSPSGSALDPVIRDQIQLKPVLRVDGRPVSEALPGEYTEAAPAPPPFGVGNIGFKQKLTVETIFPAMPDSLGAHETLNNDLVIGEAYALGAMVGVITAERMKHLTMALEAKKDANASQHELLAGALSLTALQYLHKASVSTEVFADLLGVRHLQEPSLMVCGMRLNPAGTKLDSAGLFFDIRSFWMAIASRDGRKDRARAFLFLLGMQSSYLEHKVLEEVFVTSAVSAVRVLREAMAIGLRPIILDETDIGELDGLSLPSSLKLSIQESLMQGRRVILPPTPMTIEKWSGWGYVVWDPETGAGGFIISGGIAGGFTAAPQFLISLWLVDWLPDSTGDEWYFVCSLWQDPDFEEINHCTLFHLQPALLEHPFVAAVTILPAYMSLGDIITYNPSCVPDQWLVLPTHFDVEGELSFKAVAFCFLPGQAPFSLYPREVTLDPQPTDDQVQVNSVEWFLDSGTATIDVSSSNPVTYKGEPSPGGDLLKVEVVPSHGPLPADWPPPAAPARLERGPHVGYAVLERPGLTNPNLIRNLAVLPPAIDDEQTSTTISFDVEQESWVSITLRDASLVKLKEVSNGWETVPVGETKTYVWQNNGLPEDQLPPGEYRVVVDARAKETGDKDRKYKPLWILGGCETMPFQDDPTAFPNPTDAELGTVVTCHLDTSLASAKVLLQDANTGEVLDEQVFLDSDDLQTREGLAALVWDGCFGDLTGSDRIPASDGTYQLVVTVFSPWATEPDSNCVSQKQIDISIEEGINTEYDIFAYPPVISPKIFQRNNATEPKVTFELLEDAQVRVILRDANEDTWVLKDVSLAKSLSNDPHILSPFVLPDVAVGPAEMQVIAYISYLDAHGVVRCAFDRHTEDVYVVGLVGLDLLAISLVPAGLGERNGDYFWPLQVGVSAGLASLDAVWVVVTNETGDVVVSEIHTKSEALSGWVVNVFPDDEDWVVPPGGWYTVEVTAVTSSDSSTQDYGSASMIAMVGDDLAVDPLVSPPSAPWGYEEPTGTVHWILAPNRTIEGLDGPAKIPFQLGGTPCRIGMSLVLGEGDDAKRYGLLEGPWTESNSFEDGRLLWSWDGGENHNAGDVFDATLGQFGPAPAAIGDLQMLAVDECGEYTVWTLPVAVDNTTGSLKAVSDISFHPWRVRVRPLPDSTFDYDPANVKFRVNTPGDVRVSILNSAEIPVRVLTGTAEDPESTRPMGPGLYALEWDLTGGPPDNLIVPDDTYHLKAEVIPFQPTSEALLIEDASATIQVAFDTDKLHDIGKRRGKAFYAGVDVTSGNQFLQVDDLSLPLNAHGFKWTRYYNSRDEGEGPLGVGWRHRYQVRVTRFHGGSVHVEWGDGHKELFTPDFGNEYISPKESLNTLVKQESSEAITGWTLTTPEGDLEFDADGLLKEGWGLTFKYQEYGDGDPDVHDPLPKRLTQIEEVSGPDLLVKIAYYSSDKSHLMKRVYIERIDAALGGFSQDNVEYDGYLAQNRYGFPRNDEREYYLKSVTNRLGASSYKYEFKVVTKIELTDGNDVDVYHHAMTRSDEPLSGTTLYEHEKVQEDEGIGTVRETPRVHSVNHLGGRGWAGKGLTVYSYDEANLQVTMEIEGPATEVVTYAEDEQGIPAFVTSRNDARPADYVAAMDWDEEKHLLLSSTDGAGVKRCRDYHPDTDWIWHEWYSTGDCGSSPGALGSVTREYYDDGSLKATTDERGNRTEYSYEYAVNLAQELQAALAAHPGLVASHRLLGTRVTVTDPDNYQTIRYLDADGRVVKEIDPLGHAWLMRYDDRGNLIARIDPRGHITEYEYNAWNWMTEERVPELDTDGVPTGNYISRIYYEHDEIGNREIVKDAKQQNPTTYKYDGGSRVVKQTDSFGKVVSEYVRSTDTGWISTACDLNRNETEFTYYNNGRVHEEKRCPLLSGCSNNASKLITTYNTYDGRGNNTVRTDPRGGVWNSTYDNAGRLMSVTDPTSRVTEYDYYDDGDRKTVWGYLSGVRWPRVEYETNEAGWVVKEGRYYEYDPNADPPSEPYWTEYRYDERGNRTSTIDPLGNVTRYIYRDDNLLRLEIDPFDEIRKYYTYDAYGRLYTETDQPFPNKEKETTYTGTTVRYEYGDVDEIPTRHRVAKRWDPHHFATEYDYDNISRITTETRAGLSVTYGYDANGNRVSVIDGEGNRHHSIYDMSNRLCYEYVALETDTDYRQDFPPTDFDSNKTPIPSGAATTGKLLRTLAYDDLSRVASETQTETLEDAQGTPVVVNYTTNYSYYDNDWLRQIDYPDTAWEQYAYNAAGIKTLVRRQNGNETLTPTTSFDLTPRQAGNMNPGETYYELDDETQLQVEMIVHPDGRTERFTYTNANDLLSHTNRDGVTDWFAYDNHHRVNQRWRQSAPTSPELVPVDCIVETIPVDPYGTAEGILLQAREYNAAGDVVKEANSYQAFMGQSSAGDRLAVAVEYDYEGDPAVPTNTDPVRLVKKTDPLSTDKDRNWYYMYYPNTDRVEKEMVALPSDSGYGGTSPDQYEGVDVLSTATYTYDLAGNVLTVLDGDDRQRRFAYDELNRNKEEWFGKTDSMLQMASLTYDGRGNVITETVYGINNTDTATTTHTYDSRGRKIHTDHPDGTEETWTYNAAGNLEKYKDQDGRIT